MTSLRSSVSIDFGGVSFPLSTVTSNSSSPSSSVIISFNKLFDAVSIIRVKDDGLNRGLSTRSTGYILRYESILPASSLSIYFHALIIKSFFRELYIELLVKEYSPGKSINRLPESFFHSLAASFLSLIMSLSSLSPYSLAYSSGLKDLASEIKLARGCLGSSKFILSISLLYALYHLARFCKRDFLILLIIGIKSSRLVLPSRYSMRVSSISSATLSAGKFIRFFFLLKNSRIAGLICLASSSINRLEYCSILAPSI